jgi:ferritin-like metal-binding protein YciE
MLLDNFSDLFQRGLEYAWDIEDVLLNHLPRMVDAASSPDLKQILEFHLVETKGHIYRLEQIFRRLDRSPAAEKHEPVRIIVSECERIIGHLDRSALLDAALIYCGHQIEQSEIGIYEPLVGFALTLGFEDVAGAIDEILGQERETSHQLMRLAASSINRAASRVENARPFALI